MPRLALDAAAMAAELTEISARAARGLRTLRAVGEQRPGGTPRRPVWSDDGVTLFRYGAAASGAPPILVVYALVNRPDMADLAHGRSLVGDLLARGFDVYLLDWGYPSAADGARGLDDYLLRFLDGAVDYLREVLARPQLCLLGICQGGTFSLCYTALRPHKVERLVTTVTPVDFHTADDTLSHLARAIDFSALVSAQGNLPGDWLNGLFLALKPYQLLQQKYVRFIDGLDDADATALFLRMEHWIFDSPALAGRAAREFAEAFYQRNALAAGELHIGGEAVDLTRLELPVLNIYAAGDHLVPPAASRALANLLARADYTEYVLPGGHIGIYVGSRNTRPVADVVADWAGFTRRNKS